MSYAMNYGSVFKAGLFAGQTVIARLRPLLAQVTGVSLFLNPVQDLRMGGRQSNSTYQYTLKSDNAADLKQVGHKAG